MKQIKTRAIAEFGDFQTPRSLALAAMKVVASLGIRPQSILEPTCGFGSFVEAAATTFPDAALILGHDINAAHLETARGYTENDQRIRLRQADFFSTDWEEVLNGGRAPWLITGNPPWVTSAELSAINSENVPAKANFQGRSGIEAITGKSNFDISEWMILRYLDWLGRGSGALAVLCKTSVARKILHSAWKRRLPVKGARIYKIDALAQFGAAVDACLFVVEAANGQGGTSCEVFESLEAATSSRMIAYQDGHLVSDAGAFNRRRSLLGPERSYVWRSGIKHDCSKVMELAPVESGYLNGFGEHVAIESRFLYPLLKSSDIGNGRLQARRAMIVTQQRVGEDTGCIEREAPKTWRYLQAHLGLFDKRGSSIYRNKPSFSIFGVGAYSFAPWKIAISGFYKRLQFLQVGPVNGTPVVFDDTVYFLPCTSEEESRFLLDLLMSTPATEFFHSMISWDEKRPITVDLLKRLSIHKLAAALNREEEYTRFTGLLDGPLFIARSRSAA